MRLTLSLILLLIVNLNLSSMAFSNPSESDRQEAMNLMYVLSSDQDLHFSETSNYESSDPISYKGLLIQSCAYSNFVGKGYVVTVSKVEDLKLWEIERHFGDDSSVEEKINEVWTCMNCAGETVSITKNKNEHSLCEYN